MSDILDKVRSEQNPFEKILGKIPGFKGYFERENRRDADKLLRETVAKRFEEQWQRVSAIQRDLLTQGDLSQIDDIEVAALKLRTFADRIRTASYGYAGLFDAIKIGEDELAQLYAYDLALLDYPEKISGAIDNMEAAIGTDGINAAIRGLVDITQESIMIYDKRSEVILTHLSQ